jgi:hypothetical protein
MDLLIGVAALLGAAVAMGFYYRHRRQQTHRAGLLTKLDQGRTKGRK